MPNRLIKIIYASASGNVEVTCEYIAEKLSAAGFDISLHRAEQTDVSELQSHDRFILSTSTWAHGEFSPFFSNLYKQMAGTDLSGKQSAFVGLGDTRYEPVHFCGGMELIKERFIEQGGSELGEMLKIDGDPHDQLEGEVLPWTNKLIGILAN